MKNIFAFLMIFLFLSTIVNADECADVGYGHPKFAYCSAIDPSAKKICKQTMTFLQDNGYNVQLVADYCTNDKFYNNNQAWCDSEDHIYTVTKEIQGKPTMMCGPIFHDEASSHYEKNPDGSLTDLGLELHKLLSSQMVYMTLFFQNWSNINNLSIYFPYSEYENQHEFFPLNLEELRTGGWPAQEIIYDFIGDSKLLGLCIDGEGYEKGYWTETTSSQCF